MFIYMKRRDKYVLAIHFSSLLFCLVCVANMFFIYYYDYDILTVDWPIQQDDIIYASGIFFGIFVLIYLLTIVYFIFRFFQKDE